MQVLKQFGRIILDDNEKARIFQVRSMACPECGNSMIFYEAPSSMKPEMACHDRKLSAPLWKN